MPTTGLTQSPAGSAPASMPNLQDEPCLRPLRWHARIWQLWRYAWQSRRVEITVAIAAVVALVLGMLYVAGFRPPWGFTSTKPPGDLAAWLSNVQALLGAFTLLVAIFVWFGELREDWEQELPCRMSVYFFHEGRPAIVCRHIWLAGADDLRAWGQQVAAQAASDRLDFSSNVTAQPPVIACTPDGAACRHYAVCFQLTTLPKAMAGETGHCRYQNLVTTNTSVRSLPTEVVEALPEVTAWQERSRVSREAFNL